MDAARDTLRDLWLHGATFGVDEGAPGGTWQGLLEVRGDHHWVRVAGKTFVEMDEVATVPLRLLAAAR